ncbi:MAG: tyrosine/phenylalanine carboxypeptidase domain-containing protein [Candidatus Saccharimonadaceae bacterium]
MIAEKTDIPKVSVLGPITPSVDSARSEKLEYLTLESTAKKHAAFDRKRVTEFWNTEEGSLNEYEAAQQLAMQYMLMGALALSKTNNPEIWSKRYTEATSELFGVPEPEIARKLWQEQQSDSVETETGFEDVAEKVGIYLNEKYAPVFDALDIESSSEPIQPSEIADKFEAALAVLASQYDSDWSNWSVSRNNEKDSLAVSAGSKKIIVGMQRASVTPQQLKALFSHEVLVHGLRGLNGQKVSKEFGTGLAGYIDAEEGFGVFIEYAISGKVSEKNIDRYVDIAYALGQIDGNEHTRKELVDHALQRATARNEKSGNVKSNQDVLKEVYAHVNRIYRGSLGNENVGIFTKDIAYYKGFVDMGRYIQTQIHEGKTVEEVIEHLLQGKFDPTNSLHLGYMDEHIKS